MLFPFFQQAMEPILVIDLSAFRQIVKSLAVICFYVHYLLVSLFCYYSLIIGYNKFIVVLVLFLEAIVALSSNLLIDIDHSKQPFCNTNSNIVCIYLVPIQPLILYPYQHLLIETPPSVYDPDTIYNCRVIIPLSSNRHMLPPI